MRATLMSSIAAVIENHGWSQRKAGDNLGLTQSRVCDLTAGRIDTFTLDELCSIDASTWVYRYVYTHILRPDLADTAAQTTAQHGRDTPLT